MRKYHFKTNKQTNIEISFNKQRHEGKTEHNQIIEYKMMETNKLTYCV